MTAQTTSSDFIKEFLATLPSQFKNLHQSALNELTPKLESWLSSLNLVTKTQFDAQAKILEKAQKDIVTLKSALETLEKQTEKSIA